MIVYVYDNGNARHGAPGGKVYLHRAEGEPAARTENFRGQEVDHVRSVKNGTYHRSCDGTVVSKDHVKHEDIAKVPQWLIACSGCFRHRYDELLPLYRKIPTGVVTGGTGA